MKISILFFMSAVVLTRLSYADSYKLPFLRDQSAIKSVAIEKSPASCRDF